MAYEKQAATFLEAKASRVSHTDLPLLHTEQLVREFKTVNDAEKALDIAYLNAYISAKNAAPSTTITDPQADGSGTNPDGSLKNVFEGLWRHVSTVWSAERSSYVQTLRKGWATEVLTAGLPNDECMVRTETDPRADTRTLTFYWNNIAATAKVACVTALRATGSFTNPIVQGETNTGKWAIEDVSAQQSEDGSYVVTVACQRVVSVAAVADLAGIAPVREKVLDVDNPFGLAGGYTTHAAKEYKEGLTLTYRNLDVSSRAVLEALTTAQLWTLLAGSTTTPPTGDALKYEAVKSSVTNTTNNTITLACVYRYVPLATSAPESAARFQSLTRFNQSGKLVVVRIWPRIDPSVVDTLLTTAANLIPNVITGPLVDGKEYSGDWLAKTTKGAESADDGVTIIQELTKAGDQKLDIVFAPDPEHKVYEFHRWDYSTAEIDDFMNEAGSDAHVPPTPLLYNWSTPENGKTKIVRVTKNADETFDLFAQLSDTATYTKLQLYTGGTPGPLTVGAVTGVDSVRTFGWNIPVTALKTYSDAYVNAGTAADVNKKRTFTISRRTEFVFDFQGEIITFTERDSDWLEVSDTATETVSVRLGAYVVAAHLADGQAFGSPASVPVNTKYEQQFKENDYGSFDGQLLRTVYKEFESDDVIIRDDAQATVTRREGKHLLAATIAARFTAPVSPTAGTTVEVEVKENEVQSFDAVKVTTVVKDQTNTTTVTGSDKIVTRTEHTALTAAEVANIDDARAAGEVVSLADEERPDGKKKAVLTLEQEQDQTTLGGRSSLLHTVAIEDHTSSTAPEVAGGGVNAWTDVTAVPTPGGRQKTHIEQNQLHPWSGNEVVVSDDGVQKITKKIGKNVLAPTAVTPGKELKLTDNGHGAYNEELESVGLSLGAAETKKRHLSSVLQWDNDGFNFKTPTYTTNEAEGTVITGYNIWKATQARYRTVTTDISREYSTTEPAAVAYGAATAGDGEGSGDSYFCDVEEARKNLWVTVRKRITTSSWSAWGYKQFIFIEWTGIGKGS